MALVQMEVSRPTCMSKDECSKHYSAPSSTGFTHINECSFVQNFPALKLLCSYGEKDDTVNPNLMPLAWEVSKQALRLMSNGVSIPC